MKMSKKLVSIFTVFCIVFASIPMVTANDITTTTIPVENGYIVKTVNKNNQLNLTLYRTLQTHSNDAKTDLAQTRNELKALGLQDVVLSSLSDEDLMEYASGNSIVATISYFKTDKNGNAVLISEDEALKAVEKDFVSPTSISPDDDDQDDDGYLRVWHAYEYLGNGNYKFATAARWLRMPVFRYTDSLGSAAMNCTVVKNSESGFYSYESVQSDSNGNIVERLTHEDTETAFRSKDFQEAVNGVFYGTGATFKVPSDDVSQDYDSYVYSDFNVYVEYRGKVVYPDNTSNFNTKGTYDHTEFRIGLTPSLSIDDRGGFSGTIGIAPEIVKYTSPMTVKLDVTYRP